MLVKEIKHDFYLQLKPELIKTDYMIKKFFEHHYVNDWSYVIIKKYKMRVDKRERYHISACSVNA